MVTTDSTYLSQRAILESHAGFVQSYSILGENKKPVQTKDDGAWGALTEKKAEDTQQSSSTTQSFARSTF
ncbi:hypothetical protein SKAU_G00219920 [Synaphobranchus kaupii]|uniref:Uncharacterized protein n=1 Tax=Synaphobranchus kaupii TaxID=118154 RepID=A0A9Q1FAR0_SYNKA|nr:hypothetical protein SKAU_G00219920 [Synaphobranchus kaupii]